MTDVTFSQAMPERSFQVNVSNSADLKSTKTVETHRTQGPQEVAFEKSGMATLLLCTFFAYLVLFTASFMMHNFFAIKILSVEAILIIAAVFIVKKM